MNIASILRVASNYSSRIDRISILRSAMTIWGRWGISWPADAQRSLTQAAKGVHLGLSCHARNVRIQVWTSSVAKSCDFHFVLSLSGHLVNKGSSFMWISQTFSLVKGWRLCWGFVVTLNKFSNSGSMFSRAHKVAWADITTCRPSDASHLLFYLLRDSDFNSEPSTLTRALSAFYPGISFPDRWDWMTTFFQNSLPRQVGLNDDLFQIPVAFPDRWDWMITSS